MSSSFSTSRTFLVKSIAALSSALGMDNCPLTETPLGSTLLFPHMKATWIVLSDVTVLKYMT